MLLPKNLNSMYLNYNYRYEMVMCFIFKIFPYLYTEMPKNKDQPNSKDYF